MTENKKVFYFIFATGILMAVLAIISPGFEGGDDCVFLYYHSKSCFAVPQLLIHIPIKALYYPLCYPAASLGFTAMKIQNIIFACITAWLTYKISQKLNFKYSWLIPILVLYNPLYFLVSISTLTEIMFSMILILIVYLILYEKIIAASIILSFLPFIRSEGFVLMIPIAFYLFSEKKYKYIFLFSFGTIIYSVVGFSYHNNDWLWVFHNNYGNASNIYGRQEFLHFVKQTKNINGAIMTVFLPVAFLMFCNKIYKRFFKKIYIEKFNIILFLIFGIFFGFFALHTFLAWQGMGASLGLIRVFACVTPFSALVVLWFYNEFFKRFIHPKLILIPTILLCFINPFKVDKYPVPLTEEQKNISIASDYFTSHYNKKTYLLFSSNYFCFKTNINIDDTNLCRSYYHLSDTYLNYFDKGTVVMYDTHFGPNESQTPLDSLLHYKNLKLVYCGRPAVPYKTLGNYDYEIYLFEKK